MSGRRAVRAAWTLAAGLTAGALVAPVGARAQAPAKAPPEAALIAVGGHIGSLGGLTVRTPARTPRSWTLLLAIDGDGRAVGGANRQVETRLPRSPLRLFVAPGVFAGTADGAFEAGVNTAVGFGFYRARFDVYLTAVPTVSAIGRARPRIDAAAGVRYAL